MRTFIPKNKDLVKEFQVVDASGMILGRVCAKIASILKGKDKTIVTPGVHCGDRVIVINADKIAVTSNKLDTAIHYKHSGYLGSLRELTLRYRMEKDSREVIRTTVKRMLGRGPLARERLRGLFVYKGPEHDQRSVKIRDPRECSMFRLGKERLDRLVTEEFANLELIPQKAPPSSFEISEKKPRKQKLVEAPESVFNAEVLHETNTVAPKAKARPGSSAKSKAEADVLAMDHDAHGENHENFGDQKVEKKAKSVNKKKEDNDE